MSMKTQQTQKQTKNPVVAEMKPKPGAPAAPVPVAVIEPVKPAIAAPVKPALTPEPQQKQLVKPHTLPEQQLLDRRCMSRAGCRWQGERESARVMKKPVAPTTDLATKP